MPFGFFDWLRVRTRDAILDGAEEAGAVLQEGPGAASEGSQSVVSLNVPLRAVLTERTSEAPGSTGPTLDQPAKQEQLEQPPVTGPKTDERPKTESKARRPSPGRAPAQPTKAPEKALVPDERVPRMDKKTEALFDASRGIKPS
jgi:hypothetical protein